jgi:mono/diheme cytochrome c family protein
MRSTLWTPRNALLALIGTMTLGTLGLETNPAMVVSAQGVAPTYYVDVQPILEQHCVSCHVAGGIAPFTDIARVVTSGAMPPWPPGAESPPFLNERKLGAASKQIIADWAKAGAPLGKPSAGQKP